MSVAGVLIYFLPGAYLKKYNHNGGKSKQETKNAKINCLQNWKNTIIVDKKVSIEELKSKFF